VYTISSKSWESIDDPDAIVDGMQTTVVNGINDKGVLVGFYGNPFSGQVSLPLVRSSVMMTDREILH
jgi:hypothetical protein